jgi:hypothetical protein
VKALIGDDVGAVQLGGLRGVPILPAMLQRVDVDLRDAAGQITYGEHLQDRPDRVHVSVVCDVVASDHPPASRPRQHQAVVLETA